MAQGKKKLASKEAPKFIKANQTKTHKTAKASTRKGPKKMKIKSFQSKLYNEVEKSIRANIEDEMKLRAGRSEKQQKQQKKN